MTGPARFGSGRNRSREAGETLLEILATITIMSLGVGAIVAGTAASVRMSTKHRSIANAQVALGAAAEAVKAATPVACTGSYVTPYANAVAAIVPTASLPAGWLTSSLSVTATCASGTGLQKVTVTVAAPGTAITEHVDVLRRSP